MLHELAPADFASVRDLFEPLRFRLDSVVALDGTKPARLWVNDPAAPTAALLVGTMASFLAGEPTDAFCRDLARWIREVYYVEDPLCRGRKAVRLIASSGAWEERIDAIFPDRKAIPSRRRYFDLDLLGVLPAFPPPDGYAIRPIDAGLFADGEIEIGPGLIRSMEWGHGSVDAYLENGFGCVAVVDGKAVAECMVNAVSGPVCELGVGTRDEHRRKGLAVATGAATFRAARERGYERAEWNCDPRNPASVRVAERLGFTHRREYTCWLAVGDEKIHEEQWVRWREGKLV